MSDRRYQDRPNYNLYNISEEELNFIKEMNKRQEEKERASAILKKTMAVIAWIVSLIMSIGLIQYGIEEVENPAIVIVGLLLGIASTIVVSMMLFGWEINLPKIDIKNTFKQSTIYKDYCYKRIVKYHKYYEIGAITKEQFESFKRYYLNKLK